MCVDAIARDRSSILAYRRPICLDHARQRGSHTPLIEVARLVTLMAPPAHLHIENRLGDVQKGGTVPMATMYCIQRAS